MAEYDDERPDFDAVFSDPPGDEMRAGRRRARKDRAVDEPDDMQGTGEVPRPRLGDEGYRVPEEPGDPSFADDDDEPVPPPRSRRGGGSSRSRSRSTARSRSGGDRPSRSRDTGTRGGGRSGGPGASLLQHPRARMLLLAAFAVILVVVIALVVKDCRRSQLEDSYTNYINGVAQVVTKSAAQGADLRKVIANPRGDKPPVLKAKIAAIAKQARDLVDEADGLDPPGSLAGPQRSLIAGVLEYRVTGLTNLANGLPILLQAGTAQNAKAAGIAESMKRFLASDVVYEDSFAGPAAVALRDDDITGIKVPPLLPFLPNAAFASSEGAKTLLPALQRSPQAGATGTSAGTGNLLGTSLESTVALPSETRLSTSGDTVRIPASSELAWQVTVKNGGDFDVTNVIVRASFSYPTAPNVIDKREVSIASLASGASTTVTIPGPSADVVAGAYGDPATLRIEVAPVTGETKIDNNSADYPVTITI